jgi:hypothetical protein
VKPTMRLRTYKAVRAHAEIVDGIISPIYGPPVLQQWWEHDETWTGNPLALERGEWRNVPEVWEQRESVKRDEF